MSAWAPQPWQQERWGQVRGAQAAGRLAHALLLAGPRGAGKGHFARGVAALLLCEAPRGEKPCGSCRSCVQLAAGSHPNALLLSREGLHCVALDPARQEGAIPLWQPDKDSARREIAIDAIRALVERLGMAAHYGQAKVAIVAPADALNANGANALLKTVEEPPPATHLLLAAERWGALPATLRSRCQILRLTRPRAAADTHAPDDWSRALAEACEGRLSGLRLAQGLKRDGAQQALETWLRTATAWLRAGAAPGQGSAAPARLGPEAIAGVLDDVLEARRALERNGSPSLLVESIMIRASQRG